MSALPIVPATGAATRPKRGKTVSTRPASARPRPPRSHLIKAAARPVPVFDETALQNTQAWVKSFSLACIEILKGSRRLDQIAPWIDPELYKALGLRATLAARQRPAQTLITPTRIISASCRITAQGHCEARASVHDGTRIRAIALRLELHRGRWRTTALEIG